MINRGGKAAGHGFGAEVIKPPLRDYGIMLRKKMDVKKILYLHGCGCCGAGDIRFNVVGEGDWTVKAAKKAVGR